MKKISEVIKERGSHLIVYAIKQGVDSYIILGLIKRYNELFETDIVMEQDVEPLYEQVFK